VLLIRTERFVLLCFVFVWFCDSHVNLLSVKLIYSC
jgi:hypothetical protein